LVCCIAVRADGANWLGIVSETLFALLYSFAWDGQWPSLAQSAACVLFTLGILVSIKAHA
jgi:hypothetical protein